MLLILDFSAVVNFVLNLFVIPLLYDRGAAITTIIAECIMFLLVRRESGKVMRTKMNMHNLLPVIVGCAGIACVCYVSQIVMHNPAGILLVSIPLSVILYGGIQILMKNTAIFAGGSRSIS